MSASLRDDMTRPAHLVGRALHLVGRALAAILLLIATACGDVERSGTGANDAAQNGSAEHVVPESDSTPSPGEANNAQLPTTSSTEVGRLRSTLARLAATRKIPTRSLITAAGSSDPVTRLSAAYLLVQYGSEALADLRNAWAVVSDDELGLRHHRLWKAIRNGDHSLEYRWEYIHRRPNGESLTDDEYMKLALQKTRVDTEKLRQSLSAPLLSTRLGYLKTAAIVTRDVVAPLGPELTGLLASPESVLPRGMILDSKEFRLCREMLGDPRVLVIRAMTNAQVVLDANLHELLEGLAAVNWEPLAAASKDALRTLPR